MTEEKRASAASQRRARVGGLVLSRPQIILAGCGIVVGFLVCLVVGFIGGAWWQTQEQMAFRVDPGALAERQLDREQAAASSAREMTFYDTLTATTRAGAPESEPKTEPKPEAPPQVAAIPQAVVRPEAVAQPEAATPAATETAPTPGKPFYSIQVGSFRSAEQAHSLREQLLKKGYEARVGLAMAQGAAWYRVRVGRYAERGAADRTAQRLRDSEKVKVLVLRESS